MKKQLRTFTVKESFNYPYTGQIHQPQTILEEGDLLESGWAKQDIAAAIPSLLVVNIWPKKSSKKDEK